MKATDKTPRTEFIQVSTTVDTRKAATAIAMKLLKGRLTSCVQIVGPITSRYWWKGRILNAREWPCLIKARAQDYRMIELTLKKVHPYKVPEITALPILFGDPGYLNWIRKETDRRTSR
jgi:periplasmic divalent cation tolerance protein